MGHTVKYTYEGGNLASVTLPGETSPHWRFKYNSSHELTSETNGLGHTVTSEYNSSHQVIAQTDAMGRTRTWRYNATEPGRETLIHEPNGSQTLEFFEELGQPTSVKRAFDSLVEASTAYVYNSANELAAVIDPDGHTTEYGYDSAGDRTSEKDADGDETKWTYDSTHDLQTMTTPKGETTTIKREAHGNPEVIERPAPGGKTQLTANWKASPTHWNTRGNTNTTPRATERPKPTRKATSAPGNTTKTPRRPPPSARAATSKAPNRRNSRPKSNGMPKAGH